MKNIGFVEKNDTDNIDTIKFLVDSAKGIKTIKMQKEESPMTEETNVAPEALVAEDAPVVENVEVAPEANAEAETPAPVTEEVVETPAEADATVTETPVAVQEVVEKSDEVVATAISDIKTTLSNAFGDLAATVKSINDQVAELTKSLSTVTDNVTNVAKEVADVKGNFNEFGKRVDAVEAATKKKFEDGMVLEREIFTSLMMTPESRALRHIFMADRAASKIADVPEDTPKRNIASVAVIGAGTMGGGISMNFLNAGIPVKMLEMKQEALDRGIATIRKNYESQVKKGKLKQDKYEQRMALLSTTLSYDDIGSADLVIEAVFEEMGVKEAVFKKLDEVMKPGAILASNTSTLDVNKIAAFTKRPEDVVGMHFFSPANVMKLLEVVRGAKTSKDVLATVMALGKKIKKTSVVSGVCDGFIGNRMIEQYSRQAGFLIEEGCTPAQVDKAVEKFGFAMGPFRMGDLAGNDIGWAIRKRRNVERPGMKYSKTADLLCEMGRYGQKTGAGWYDYQAGKRDAIPSALVVEMIEKHRAAEGISTRKISDEEIVQRLVYSLVNEAAHILEEGIAGKASDIDMVYLTGYGFPIFRGGPMLYADQVGLFNVAEAMKRFAKNPHDDAAFWQPAPLLARLVADGKTFN
jgi:3-hydroxyacyl-CoA dehydrogenase